MKEVVTQSWCDVHNAAGERVEAQITRTIALDGGSERELDVCIDCDEKVFTPLVKLLNGARASELALARRPARRTTERNKEAPSLQATSCPICGGTFSTRKSATDHIWARHTDQEIPRQPDQCPDCGYTSAFAQAMGRHRTVEHGYDNWSQALSAAGHRAKGRRRG